MPLDGVDYSFWASNFPLDMPAADCVYVTADYHVGIDVWLERVQPCAGMRIRLPGGQPPRPGLRSDIRSFLSRSSLPLVQSLNVTQNH